MSYTEMVCFRENGEAEQYEDIQNAWLGAMAVWSALEAKYLPAYRPSFVPSHIPNEKVEDFLGYKPSRTSALFDPNGMKDIWDLMNQENVSKKDKIVLYSTFDRTLVKREHFDELIAAFRSFEGNTSLPKQADVLEEMLKDESIIAVGWNQTSVNSNLWFEWDEESEEDVPYNCLTGDEHYWLFEEIDEKRK